MVIFRNKSKARKGGNMGKHRRMGRREFLGKAAIAAATAV
jgi:hypothetical protein